MRLVLWAVHVVGIQSVMVLSNLLGAEITHTKKGAREMNNKPLTEADAPYQKVVSKEITDEIGKALSLKTLTDEEIMSEWEESKDEVDFARAILRKAQEK